MTPLTEELLNSISNIADAILIPSTDEYLSEFTPQNKNKLSIATGFTGSNGIALIIPKTKEFFLFTDGRYLLQAQTQVSEEFKIEDIQNFKKTICNLKSYNSLAIDPKLHSIKFTEDLKSQLTQSGKTLITLPSNPIKNLKSKTPTSQEPTLDFQLTSKTTKEKLSDLSTHLKSNSIDALFIFSPEETCWLLNKRLDISKDYKPTPTLSILSIIFFDKDNQLNHETFTVETLQETLKKLEGAISNSPKPTILINNTASYHCLLCIKETFNQANIQFDKDQYIANKKSIKQDTEISSFKKAFALDNVVVTKFINFITKDYKTHTEQSATRKLQQLREENPEFLGNSFDTICGVNKNSAIIHYNPLQQNTQNKEEPETKLNQRESGNLLLVDSGGQYYSPSTKTAGTTDVTRTILLGKTPKPEWVLSYTLVLKGHIALAQAVFPQNTQGSALDTLARQFLWQSGYNYPHGTGHGVGHFLSVHEGPASISPHSNTAPLKEGMILSNEPGVYFDNKFGIRLENLVLVAQHPTIPNFLHFETLTNIKFDTHLIDWNLLSDKELKWLEEYTVKCPKI